MPKLNLKKAYDIQKRITKQQELKMNRKKEKSSNPKFQKRFDELKEKLLRVKKLLAQEMLTNRKFK